MCPLFLHTKNYQLSMNSTTIIILSQNISSQRHASVYDRERIMPICRSSRIIRYALLQPCIHSFKLLFVVACVCSFVTMLTLYGSFVTLSTTYNGTLRQNGSDSIQKVTSRIDEQWLSNNAVKFARWQQHPAVGRGTRCDMHGTSFFIFV